MKTFTIEYFTIVKIETQQKSEIEAKNLKTAIKVARKQCRDNKQKFISAKLK